MKKQFGRILYFIVIGATARSDDGGKGFTASLRNCTELIGFGPIPFAAARALVPASYTVVPFNGNAGLVVRASRCENVRAGNSDSNSAVVAQVGIAVVPPDGTGDINNYTLLYSTNNGRLADELNDAGVPAVQDRALAYEFTPNTTGSGELYVAVSPNNAQASYFLTGTAAPPPSTGAPVVANWWFNSSRSVIKMATSIPSISYGTASFSLHTSKMSPVGQLIGGNTDATFVLFNARGLFNTGTLAVTVRESH